MLTRRPFLLAVATSVMCACSGSATHRTVPPGDGGLDGGVDAGGPPLGAGGSQNRTPDAHVPTDARTRPVDARAAGGAPTQPDAHDIPDAHSDASVSTDAGSTGPVLGEFCAFADANLEGFVRNALENLGVDGGVPSGPIAVTLAARVTSLDLFCDCSDVLDFVGVECLTGLQSLNLAGDYTSIDRLALLPTLQEISFQYTSTLPDELAALKKLKTLDLHGNSVTDVSVVADMTGLTEINLAGNQVSDLSPLSGLTNLRTLNLYSNQIVDLTPLSGLHGLDALNIGSNQITTLAAISGLTNLTRLEAASDGFTNLTPLTGLTNLSYLDLDGNAITNFAPLAANAGIAAGDQLYATPNSADCASFKTDVKALADRGVVLNGFPTCP